MQGISAEDKEILYEFVDTLLGIAYDNTRRGKKGAWGKAEKLGAKLVEREILTEQQVYELLGWR